MSYIKLIFLLPYLLIRKLFITEEPTKYYGLHAYTGSFGSGKTLSMSYKLDTIRKRERNNVYICTNFGYADEDFPYTGWEILTRDYDKPLIVCWDEIQSEMFSRNWQKFPVALFQTLCECRKGKGILLMYGTQNLENVDSVIRRFTSVVFECSTILGGYTICRGYEGKSYKGFKNENNVSRETFSYLHTKSLYSKYDTLRMVQRIKNDALADKYTNDNLGDIFTDKTPAIDLTETNRLMERIAKKKAK